MQNIITGREQDGIAETTTGPVNVDGSKPSAVYEYNFAEDGGKIGTIFLRGPLLPAGAVITDSYMKVIQAAAGGAGTAQIAIGSLAAGDIQSAAAVSGAPWSTTGLKDTTAPEPGTESGYIALTANTRLRLDITVAALTQGQIDIIIAYDLP